MKKMLFILFIFPIVGFSQIDYKKGSRNYDASDWCWVYELVDTVSLQEVFVIASDSTIMVIRDNRNINRYTFYEDAIYHEEWIGERMGTKYLFDNGGFFAPDSRPIELCVEEGVIRYYLEASQIPREFQDEFGDPIELFDQYGNPYK